MIVDVHTHCLQPEHVSEAARRSAERSGYPPMQPLAFETYAEAMQVVDRSIVFGVRSERTGARSPNDFTADWVKRDPDRVIDRAGLARLMDAGYLERRDGRLTATAAGRPLLNSLLAELLA